MFGARELVSLAGASVVTSAVSFVLHQLTSALPRVWTELAISELVVWGGALAVGHVAISDAIALTLNGFVVAAATIPGVRAGGRHARRRGSPGQSP